MKHRPGQLVATLALLAGIALASACDDASPTGDGGTATRAPDFQLVDVNDSSPSHGETLSPRDHLGGVSAWYFGHST